MRAMARRAGFGEIAGMATHAVVPVGTELPGLRDEHRRIVQKLRRLRELVRGGIEAERVSSLLGELTRLLEKHFDVEERLIFPMLLVATRQAAADAVDLLREEHGTIRELLGAVLEKAGQGEIDRAALERAIRAVGRHRIREEHLLYPLFEELCPGSPLLAWGEAGRDRAAD